MSEQSQITVRKWTFGAVAALLLALFVSWIGMNDQTTLQQFLKLFGAAALTHFGAWMKDHPADQVKFSDDETPTKI